MITSADRTTIAVETTGTGTPIILIGGAFNDRSTVAALADTLAATHTAVTYDRRGRGDSTDELTTAHPQTDLVDREIEDLAAVIEHVGGRASVFGHSSGGVLALEAVMRGLPIDRVAVYETPYVVDGNRPVPATDVFDRMNSLLAVGDRDGAAALFLTEQVGVPTEMVAGMKAAPVWPFMVAQAASLPYDIAVTGPGLSLPVERLAGIAIPSLVMYGDATWPWLQTATAAVAAAVPGAHLHVLPGQDHAILQQPEPLRPLLVEFLA